MDLEGGTFEHIQLSLFSSSVKVKENDKLQKTLDSIREKYGNNIINYADIVKKK